MNFTSGLPPSDLLSLERIRGQLIRLEDTIIFSLIERAQFAYNKRIYQPGAFKAEIGSDGSWLEWFLFEIESFHSRRYTSPDEHPFTPRSQLPGPIITPQDYPPLLYPPAASHPSVNANARILAFYVDVIVPAITGAAGRKGAARRASFSAAPGAPNGAAPAAAPDEAGLDDGNYGSAATRDVEVLQALSRRIHFGMFVSESKFQSAPHDFIPHILARPPNTDALAGLITKPAVEARLLVRLANKARVYGGEMDADGRVVELSDDELALRGKLDVDEVVALYRDWVIPLTKDVEVDYLVHRLDGVPQAQIDAWLAAGKQDA